MGTPDHEDQPTPPPLTYADLERIHERLDKGSARMDLMQAELTRNTEVTTEVRELLTTFKSGFKVAGWIGRAAVWLKNLVLLGLALLGLYHGVIPGHNTPHK
jgi:hypothetical protein